MQGVSDEALGWIGEGGKGANHGGSIASSAVLGVHDEIFKAGGRVNVEKSGGSDDHAPGGGGEVEGEAAVLGFLLLHVQIGVEVGAVSIGDSFSGAENVFSDFPLVRSLNWGQVEGGRLLPG